MQAPAREPSPRLPVVCAFVLLTIASLVGSGSFLLHPGELALPAAPEPYDAAIYPWNCFWLAHAPFAEGGHLLFTKHLFHPGGEGLALYTPTYFHAVLSLPFQWLGGPSGRLYAVAFLLWFSSFATAQLTYLLARRLGASVAGATGAALLFTFCAGRMMNAPRLNLFGTEFLLAFLLLGVEFWRSRQPTQPDRRVNRLAILWGAFGAVLLLQSQPLFYQGGLVVALLVAVAGVVRLVRRQPLGGPRWQDWILAGGTFTLLAAPFLVEMVRELRVSPGLVQTQRYLELPENSLDLSSLVLAAPQDVGYGSFLAGRESNALFEGTTPGRSVSFFLGFAWVALLAAAAGLSRARSWWLPASLAAVVFLIALGPIVRWRGDALAIPAAYDAVRWFPLVGLSKSPVRLVLLVQLGLALVAGAGLQALLAPGRALHLRRVAGVALIAAAVLEQGETLPQRSLQPAHTIPPAIHALREAEGEFAVLDLPFDGVPHSAHRVNATCMALAAIHERPIFFGLYPRATRRSLREDLAPLSLFQDLVQLGDQAVPEAPITLPIPTARTLEDLRHLNVGAILVHDLHDSPPFIRRQAALLRDYVRAIPGIHEEATKLGEDYELTVFTLPR